MENKSGFLFLDKEEGLTSQKADMIIKKRLGIKKVGHLGTLDPFATGLLILGLGEGTKFLPFLSEGDKTYEATLSLGKETDTLDYTGEAIKEKEIPSFSEEKLLSILSSFLGKQKQEVPLYSAKHINGERSYVLLRKGIDFQPVTTDIDIKEITLLSYTKDTITFKAKVSKGTYIRALGRDIAYRLNTVGHLTALRRTEVGPFSLCQAKKMEEITIDDILPIPSLFTDIPVIEIEGKLLSRVKAGNEVFYQSTEPLLFFAENGSLVALYEKKEKGIYHCKRGISHE